MADEFDLEKLLPYILNTVPGYDALKNRHELAALGEAITSPIKAHVEQEQARQAAKQLMGEHAAANLGIDPEGGLPAAGRAPIAAPPTVQVPDAPPAPAEAAAPPAPMPPPAASRPGPMGAPADLAGPYAQSPSMLPGTDPDEIAAAKHAADKQVADAKFAAEEKEVADAMAEGKRQKGAANSFLPGFLTALVDPSGKMHAQQLEAAGNPLQELMQKREALGKLRTERGQQEEQDRARSLNDPDSELTKTSALALRSLGVSPPKGYTASMFEQMKGLAQLSGAQKNDAAKLIVDQHREAETVRPPKGTLAGRPGTRHKLPRRQPTMPAKRPTRPQRNISGWLLSPEIRRCSGPRLRKRNRPCTSWQKPRSSSMPRAPERPPAPTPWRRSGNYCPRWAPRRCLRRRGPRLKRWIAFSKEWADTPPAPRHWPRRAGAGMPPRKPGSKNCAARRASK